MEQNNKIFNDTDFIMVSTRLARLTTFEAAIVYGELLSFRAESIASGEAVEIDGKIFFAAMQEEIAAETSLKLRQIRQAIDKLVEIGALEKKRIGLPNINHFHIVPDRMLEFYDMKGGDL